MRKSLLIVAVLTALVLFSCKKEKSFDPNNPNGGGATGGSLLARTVTKFGTDSIGTFYEYDAQKRLILYKTGGVFFGSSFEAEIKLIRNSQGIIQKSILKTDVFAGMGIDSVVRTVHYDAAKSRYSSMAAAYFDGSDNVKDSVAFTYNTAGKITQVEYFYDDGSGTGYVREEKSEYTYDSNGNVTKEKNYEFNTGSNLYEAYEESVYEFDNKTNPMFLGNEGFVLGDIITFSPHNQTKKTYTDLTDPNQSDVATSTYIYNSNNKPVSVTQTAQGFPVPFVTTYYYK
jgi:hypothetical protein